MALFRRLLVVLIAYYVDLVLSQIGPTSWSAKPFNPPALPLAVRNPYLNTWLQQGNKPAAISSLWPAFWGGLTVTGWFAAIVIDGQAYQISGAAAGVPTLNGSVHQQSVSFTPTTTTFTMVTGPMTVNLTYLSPIEPKDLLRQSLPFSYMYITAESNDGNEHNVRMYSDISGEFLVAAPGLNVSWNAADLGNYIVLSEQLIAPVPFMEIGDHAIDATEYYCLKKISGTQTSWQISADVIDRNAATNMSTTLNNTMDAGERLLSDHWPVLGIQIDWGNIQQTSEPAVFTLGLVRDPVIQYKLPNNTIQLRSPYYRSTFSNDTEAFFMDDFTRAQQAAASYDNELLSAGLEFSSNYADLIALSARQILGTIDITIARGSDGNWNFTDVLVFMKNMGAAGSDSVTSGPVAQGVNTVDSLFTAFPAFLYFNPELAGYLLAPLLNYQDSPAYTLDYAAKNIGSGYPNATADNINVAHSYGIEETANMLIMTLAYTQISGNKTFISDHYNMLRNWTYYLGNNTLAPSNQRWAESDFQESLSTNNQTNLALKGIIGIAAMSRMASLAGNDGDASQFNSTATSYIETWQSNAIASDNANVDFFYGDANTDGLIYNLYADVMLGLDFVPSEVYDILTTYYNNIAQQDTYGLPLMNQVPSLTSTAGMMLSAATVTNNSTRDFLVSQVRQFGASNQNNTPSAAYYNPETGFVDNAPYNAAGVNSPTIGSVFSFLVKGTVLSSSGGSGPSTSSSSSQHSSKVNVGAIAGGVAGGVIGIGLIVIGVFLWLRRRRASRVEEELHSNPLPYVAQVHTPYGFATGSHVEPFTYTTASESYEAQSPPFSDTSVSPRSPARSVLALGSTHKSRQVGAVRRYDHEPAISEEPYSPSARRDSTADNGRGGESQADSSNVSSSAGLMTTSRSRARNGPRTTTRDSGAESPPQLLVQQSLVNNQLRNEVDSLRRDLERIRQGVIEVAPPRYTDDLSDP